METFEAIGKVLIVGEFIITIGTHDDLLETRISVSCQSFESVHSPDSKIVQVFICQPAGVRARMLADTRQTCSTERCPMGALRD